MAEEIRDVVVRLAIQQTQTQVKVDTEAAKKNVDALKGEMAKLSKEAAAVDLAMLKVNRANRAAVQSFSAAASGVLGLVRGVALLGLSAEEDLQKFLSVMAKIQGTMDLLQGSVRTVQNVSRGLELLGLASSTVAVANTRAAVATTGFAASLTALQASFPPLLIAGAGIAALIALMKALDDSTDGAAEATQKFIDKEHELAALLREKRRLERERRGFIPSAEGMKEIEEHGRAAAVRTGSLESLESQAPTLARIQREMIARGEGPGMKILSGTMGGIGARTEAAPFEQRSQIEHNRATREWQEEQEELGKRINESRRHELELQKQYLQGITDLLQKVPEGPGGWMEKGQLEKDMEVLRQSIAGLIAAIIEDNQEMEQRLRSDPTP